jgi:hypothetical protein
MSTARKPRRMRRAAPRAAVAVAIAGTILGAAYLYRRYQNRGFDTLRAGMSEADVLAQMGAPTAVIVAGQLGLSADCKAKGGSRQLRYRHRSTLMASMGSVTTALVCLDESGYVMSMEYDIRHK